MIDHILLYIIVQTFNHQIQQPLQIIYTNTMPRLLQSMHTKSLWSTGYTPQPIHDLLRPLLIPPIHDRMYQFFTLVAINTFSIDWWYSCWAKFDTSSLAICKSNTHLSPLSRCCRLLAIHIAIALLNPCFSVSKVVTSFLDEMKRGMEEIALSALWTDGSGWPGTESKSKCASAAVLKTPHLNHQLLQMNTATLSVHLENAHKMKRDCGLPSSREVLMYSVHRWRRIEWCGASSIDRWNCCIPECLDRVPRVGVVFPLVSWLGFVNSGAFVHKRWLHKSNCIQRVLILAFPNIPWRNTNHFSITVLFRHSVVHRRRNDFTHPRPSQERTWWF